MMFRMRNTMGRVVVTAKIAHIFAGHGRIEDAASLDLSLNLNDLLCQIQDRRWPVNL